jgi:hypothetical protein
MANCTRSITVHFNADGERMIVVSAGMNTRNMLGANIPYEILNGSQILSDVDSDDLRKLTTRDNVLDIEVEVQGVLLTPKELEETDDSGLIAVQLLHFSGTDKQAFVLSLFEKGVIGEDEYVKYQNQPGLFNSKYNFAYAINADILEFNYSLIEGVNCDTGSDMAAFTNTMIFPNGQRLIAPFAIFYLTAWCDYLVEVVTAADMAITNSAAKMPLLYEYRSVNSQWEKVTKNVKPGGARQFIQSLTAEVSDLNTYDFGVKFRKWLLKEELQKTTSSALLKYLRKQNENTRVFGVTPDDFEGLTPEQIDELLLPISKALLIPKVTYLPGVTPPHENEVSFKANGTNTTPGANPNRRLSPAEQLGALFAKPTPVVDVVKPETVIIDVPEVIVADVAEKPNDEEDAAAGEFDDGFESYQGDDNDDADNYSADSADFDGVPNDDEITSTSYEGLFEYAGSDYHISAFESNLEGIPCFETRVTEFPEFVDYGDDIDDAIELARMGIKKAVLDAAAIAVDKTLYEQDAGVVQPAELTIQLTGEELAVAEAIAAIQVIDDSGEVEYSVQDAVAEAIGNHVTELLDTTGYDAAFTNFIESDVKHDHFIVADDDTKEALGIDDSQYHEVDTSLEEKLLAEALGVGDYHEPNVEEVSNVGNISVTPIELETPIVPEPIATNVVSQASIEAMTAHIPLNTVVTSIASVIPVELPLENNGGEEDEEWCEVMQLDGQSIWHYVINGEAYPIYRTITTMVPKLMPADPKKDGGFHDIQFMSPNVATYHFKKDGEFVELVHQKSESVQTSSTLEAPAVG